MTDYEDDDETLTIASSGLDTEDEDDGGDGGDWESSEEEAEKEQEQEQEQEASAGGGRGSVAAGTFGGMRGKAPKRPSVYRGVNRAKGRWVARIGTNGLYQHLGSFVNEEAAAQAYDEKAKQVFDNPTLNFLPDGSLNPKRRRKYVESTSHD